MVYSSINLLSIDCLGNVVFEIRAGQSEGSYFIYIIESDENLLIDTINNNDIKKYCKRVLSEKFLIVVRSPNGDVSLTVDRPKLNSAGLDDIFIGSEFDNSEVSYISCDCNFSVMKPCDLGVNSDGLYVNCNTGECSPKSLPFFIKSRGAEELFVSFLEPQSLPENFSLRLCDIIVTNKNASGQIKKLSNMEGGICKGLTVVANCSSERIMLNIPVRFIIKYLNGTVSYRDILIKLTRTGRYDLFFSSVINETALFKNCVELSLTDYVLKIKNVDPMINIPINQSNTLPHKVVNNNFIRIRSTGLLSDSLLKINKWYPMSKFPKKATLCSKSCYTNLHQKEVNIIVDIGYSIFGDPKEFKTISHIILRKE